MVQAIFETITQVVNGLTSAMSSALTAVGGFFWTANAEGGGQLTFVGVIAIIALGAGIVYFVIRLILGLLRSRNNA